MPVGSGAHEQSGRRGATEKRGWLSPVGFALSLLVILVVPTVLIFLVAEASPYTGDAIDSQDGNILEPGERAALNGIASIMRWVLLAGSVLGIAAIVFGTLSMRTSSRFGWATIVLACVAPVLCCVLSFWTLAAAASPDYIAPNFPVSPP